MKAVFTPGPWSVGGGYAHKTVLLNAKGNSIASGGNNRQIQGEELEATLRLAAAAPDLFYMLKDLVDLEGPQPGNNAWGKRALALIARIEGGAA